MKFVNTKRLAPVIFGGDKPWEFDLYHFPVSVIPTTEKEKLKFFKDYPNIEPDIPWWQDQHSKCSTNGFKVPNGIAPGGDNLIDGVDAFWNEGTQPEYIREIKMVLQPNTCYIPLYNWYFHNRELWITNRHYWYLNFWKIYGLPWTNDSVVLTDVEDRFNKQLNKKDWSKFSIEA